MHNNQETKRRFKKTIILYSIIIVIGLLYLLIVRITTFKIPCIFNVITGYDCPGCGITRMIAAISKFDFISAYNYNKFIFITIPLIAFLLIINTYYYIYNKKTSKLVCFIEIVYLIALIFWGLIRNF